MTGRPRSVSDEVIFDAVAQVVTEVGPGGLTLGAVARRAGLTAPALTQRFGSKRGLLLAFATRETGTVAEFFAAKRSGEPGPLTAVRAALADYTGPITTREGLANNLAFLQRDLTDPDLHERAAEQSRQLRAEIEKLLREAIEIGDLTTDAPEALAETLYAIYCGAQMTWAIDGAGDLTEWMAEHVDRVLAPYRTGPDRHLTARKGADR